MSTEERLVLYRYDRLEYRFGSPEPSASVDAAPADALTAAVDTLDPTRCRRLVLTGGSPLAHPAFWSVAARARERGIPELSLETDAEALAADGVAQRLEEHGFSRLFVVLPARSNPGYARALPGGDPDRALEGLAAALSSSLACYVVVPLMRGNLRDVEPLVQWLLSERRPRGILLFSPNVAEVPRPARRLLLPQAAVAELAARVFQRCHTAGVEYGFSSKRGVSPCAAGGVLDRFGTVFHDRVSFLRHVQDERLVRVPACRACSLSSSCPGIEQGYVETFGIGELRSVPLDASMDWKLRPLNRLDTRDYKTVSPFESEGVPEPRTLIRVNGHCNMSCAFCYVDRTAPDFAAETLERDIARLFEGGGRHLVLSGGEPTLHPELPRLVDHARRLGFATIEIQSNGVRACDLDYARELAEAGLNKITVSLHSHHAEHSDRITRLPNAFGKTVRAMHNFRALGVETQIAHVITRANYAELPEFVEFLVQEFPKQELAGAHGPHLSICFAIAQGISDLVYTWVLPTFSEIKPHFKRALDRCLETGIGFGGMIGQGGYPPCMLDGDLRYYEANLDKVFRSEDHSQQFYKAERCAQCSFDPWCVGVRRAYVECYGDDEVTPFSAEVDLAPARREPPALVALGRKPQAVT